eukprot:6993920-Lingulodinium_polyedra.AAC.1
MGLLQEHHNSNIHHSLNYRFLVNRPLTGRVHHSSCIPRGKTPHVNDARVLHSGHKCANSGAL